MSTTLRPQTAPKKRRPMTAQQARPLGRVAAPLRRQVAEHGSNPESVVAAIKADLFVVQRKIDAFRGNERTSSDMEFLERHLIGMNATTGDDLSTSETVNQLLEMLLQRLTSLATTALAACDEDTSTITPGRTGGVVALSSFVRSIAERKKMWDAAAPSLRDASCQRDADSAQPGSSANRNALGSAASPTRTSLDDALNEPTVSQLRRLIADQRQLQSQLQGALDQSNAHAQKAKEDTLRANQQAEQARRQAEQQLLEANKQRDSLQRRVTELQLEVRGLQDQLAKGRPPALTDDSAIADVSELSSIHVAVSQVAFAQVDHSVLKRCGVDTAKLVAPSVPDADTILQRVNTTLSEVLSGGSSPDVTAKATRKSASSAKVLSAEHANAEGVLWWTLGLQSRAFEKVVGRFAELEADLAKSRDESDREITRLSRVISALNERVNVVKSAALRDAEKCKAEVDQRRTRDQADATEKAASQRAASRSAILPVKGQGVTAAEREKELTARVQHQQQCIHDLQQQIAKTQQALADEQRRNAAHSRENTQLAQRAKSTESRVADSQQSVAMMEAEIQTLRSAHQTTKKELREKTASEAELQQTKWKLEVELHIAQNVIAELRQREDALSSESKEASECRELMTKTLADERRAHASELAELKGQLREARHEEEVARQVLRNERAKMLDHEREVDRLRGLDLQMDVLEQNFTNYAACKLAQREAVEEEERVLQGCVDNIGRDVFVLPGGSDSEEKVMLYLQKLQSAKSAFDAEERARKRQKATAVNWKDDRSGRKQLAQTMQQRYNAIQIFACEQRLRQIALERQTSSLEVELDETRDRAENLTLELSHAKAQCDGLVQRNTELELQRKEFSRSRVVAEQEIKTLKNTIHKMRVANEEQEKVLIDVGTRLQQAKGKDGSPGVIA